MRSSPSSKTTEDIGCCFVIFKMSLKKECGSLTLGIRNKPHRGWWSPCQWVNVITVSELTVWHGPRAGVSHCKPYAVLLFMLPVCELCSSVVTTFKMYLKSIIIISFLGIWTIGKMCWRPLRPIIPVLWKPIIKWKRGSVPYSPWTCI